MHRFTAGLAAGLSGRRHAHTRPRGKALAACSIVAAGSLWSAAAFAAVAPEVNISTKDVPGVSINPFAGGWKEVTPDAALKKKLEVYRRAQNRTNTLSAAAGFAPADIQARDASGNPTTYYVDFRDGEASDSNAFAGLYAGERSVWYNHSGFSERDNETDNLYTVAHEFFHAIFNPVVKKRGLWAIPVATRLKWMSEGIPTAVGQLSLEGFDGTSLKSRVKDGSRYAVRALGARYLDYPIDLRDEEPLPAKGMWFEVKNADQTAEILSYATSSFWHHVAVRSGGLSWVKKFIDRAPPSSKSTGGWVDWAEKGIQAGNQFANFADAYNSYIGRFVDYPYLTPTSEKDYFAWGKWQSLLFFEGCRSIELVAGAPPVEHVATIRPLSAECVLVKVKGLPAKAANIHVTLPGATDRQCSDLNVVSGFKRGLQWPVVKADNTCDWQWQFLYDPLTPNAKGEQAFVITNVRPDKPSLTTMARAVTFQFSVPALTVAASGSVTSSGSAANGSASRTAANAAKKLAVPNKASAKASQIAVIGDSSNEAESELKYQGSGCDALTREIRPCGPYTKLSFQWGEIADLAVEVALQKVQAMMGDLSALGTGMGEMQGQLMQARQSSGATIHIEFPRLEPGGSGSFSNAMITLSIDDHGESGSLESLSPSFIRPGHNPDCPHASAIYPYAGKVNIESYDANGISGSFSADFYDVPEQGCPVPFKVASVSGRFRSTPIIDVAQSDYADSPAGQKRLNALLINKFYAMTPDTVLPIGRATAWGLFAKGLANAGGNAHAGTSGGAVRAATCHCDCAEFDSPRRDECSSQCAAYGPMAAQCVIQREIGKGRSEDAVLKEINACAGDCPSLRGEVSTICGDALYSLRRACRASGPAGVTQKQIDCYLSYVVREAEEPQKSTLRQQLAEQIKAMDASTRDQFMGGILDALKGEGLNCPAS